MKVGNPASLWMQLHCNAEVQRQRHGHCGWRTGGGGSGGGGEGRGYRHSVRLPVLAHPELPISCLPACWKMPSSTPLQLKTSLSQPRQRLRRSAGPNVSFLQPPRVSRQSPPGEGKLRFITTYSSGYLWLKLYWPKQLLRLHCLKYGATNMSSLIRQRPDDLNHFIWM